jgi:hypothetical protein
LGSCYWRARPNGCCSDPTGDELPPLHGAAYSLLSQHLALRPRACGDPVALGDEVLALGRLDLQQPYPQAVARVVGVVWPIRVQGLECLVVERTSFTDAPRRSSRFAPPAGLSVHRIVVY